MFRRIHFDLLTNCQKQLLLWTILKIARSLQCSDKNQIFKLFLQQINLKNLCGRYKSNDDTLFLSIWNYSYHQIISPWKKRYCRLSLAAWICNFFLPVTQKVHQWNDYSNLSWRLLQSQHGLSIALLRKMLYFK